MTIVNVAKQYLGIKEGSKEHYHLVDTYNTLKPLPRGYKVKYSDSWCAVFVTVCCMEAGDTYPLCAECGAEEMRKLIMHATPSLLKNYLPKENDIIFFDWDGNGWANHVEIVEKAQNNLIMSIGGNVENSVKRRITMLDDKHILGYGSLRMSEIYYNPTLDEIARDVIAGKYGNGETRKENIYRLVQNRVNERLGYG